MALLRIHGDFTSQPTRAVLCFCNLTGITYTFIQHLIHKGELRSPDFLRLHPLGYIPVLEDGDFILAESHAILTYLHTTRGCEDHWYPQDPKARAKVDWYLHWHHSNLRALSTLVHHGFESIRSNANPELGKPIEAEKKAFKALETMEMWLGKRTYLTGERISIADLSAVCEISQGKLMKLSLSRFPHVNNWFNAVYGLDGVQKAHKVLEKILLKHKLTAIPT